MSYFILIDSSTKKLSLSLFADRKCLGSYMDSTEHSHAKNITLELDKLVKQNQINFSDLSAVVINQGPGSFTGLRVGSSIAKGLCFAHDIPMISINGLEAYAQYFYNKFEEQYSDIFILLDARRDNYFYAQVSKGEIVKKTSFAHITDIETDFYLSRSPWIYNSSKENIEELKSEYLIEAVILKWELKEFEDIRYFEPNYMLNNYQAKQA
jgi:tRNA threonylcarbamoyladenosine biosynthesis protein TsaB